MQHAVQTVTTHSEPIFALSFEFVPATPSIQLPDRFIVRTSACIKQVGKPIVRPVGDRTIDGAFASKVGGYIYLSLERSIKLAEEIVTEYGLNPTLSSLLQPAIFAEFQSMHPVFDKLCEQHPLPTPLTRFDKLVKRYSTKEEHPGGAIQWVETILREEITSKKTLYWLERVSDGWVFKSIIAIPDWTERVFPSSAEAENGIRRMQKLGHLRRQDADRIIASVNPS